MGTEAARLLLDLISNPAAQITTWVTAPELVVRGSTKPVGQT
jgi:DNA-binding LacI/PurR family transcriptional regulator